MSPTEKFAELTLADLSLEPLPDPNLLHYEPVKPAADKANFHAETRAKQVTDRRVSSERRQTLRFEAERRSGTDRRPRKTWEPGKNI